MTRLLQLNLNGLGDNSPELTNTLLNNNIDIAMLNEIKISNYLDTQNIPNIPGYLWVFENARTAFLVGNQLENSIKKIKIPQSKSKKPIYSIAIEVRINGTKLLLISVYRPPSTSFNNLLEFGCPHSRDGTFELSLSRMIKF